MESCGKPGKLESWKARKPESWKAIGTADGIYYSRRHELPTGGIIVIPCPGHDHIKYSSIDSLCLYDFQISRYIYLALYYLVELDYILYMNDIYYIDVYASLYFDKKDGRVKI